MRLLTLGVIVLSLARPDPAQAFSAGVPVPPGQYQAVGKLKQNMPTTRSCSATLIADRRVLTAAHCVCENGQPGACAARATFLLIDVFPADDPKTPVNEALTRTTIEIAGDVRVHPEFSKPQWAFHDLAVIELDQSAKQAAPKVTPIAVEQPSAIPNVGETMTLVGFGYTGAGCKSPGAKTKLGLSVTHSATEVIEFNHPGKAACAGDSGGPVIDGQGKVAGVLSWVGGGSTRARPTHADHNWIDGVPRPGWTTCAWHEVGIARSHGAGPAWCPAGTFLTRLDLDGDRSLSAHDAPIVGRARCCGLKGAGSAWGNCQWAPVGAQASHWLGPAWCPAGSYLVQLDLDAFAPASAHDSPVIGQARCCRLPAGQGQAWGSSYREEIGGMRSHGSGSDWCANGSFLTQLDLDAIAAAGPHDSPIVGRALCRRPRP